MGAPVLHCGALTIAARVKEMAAELDADLDDGAVVVGVTISEPPPHPEATNRTAKRILRRVMAPV